MKLQHFVSVFCLLCLSSCASLPTLPNKDFKVAITSVPEGAEVQLNAFYVGKAPLTLTINTNSSNFIYVSKVGFAGQRINLDGKQSDIKVQLVKE